MRGAQSLEGTRIENWAHCCAAASDDRTSVFWLMPKQCGLPVPGRAFAVRTTPQVDRASPVRSIPARINRSFDRAVARLPYAGLVQPYDAPEVVSRR